MKNCPICDGNLLRKSEQSIITNFKTANKSKDILLENLSFYECKSCGEIIYSREDLQTKEKALKKALEKERKARGLLTAKEIKDIRGKYKITQADLEALLGLTPKQVVRWENYRADQSKSLDKFLRIMGDDSTIFLSLVQDIPDKKKRIMILEKHQKLQKYEHVISFLQKTYPDLDKNAIIEEEAVLENISNLLKDSVNSYLCGTKNKKMKEVG